ncbi:unnamed protein product [Protopolystoma xenopodis]|uniref:Uncharacterized protein n=1 Tax=Protopolystoma xenopodis TaxID=117903 RepID=A0A448X9G3_9PLAT|nr:unnamed protein product [Protopolystoma xenopodis]
MHFRSDVVTVGPDRLTTGAHEGQSTLEHCPTAARSAENRTELGKLRSLFPIE